MVTSIQLDRCFGYFAGRYSDNSPHLSPDEAAPHGFEAFGGAERVERYLYLSDPRFAGCGESSVLRIYLGCPERGGRDLARLLEWQYWSGDRWRDLRPAPLEVDRGEIRFLGPLRFEPTTVAEIEGLWVRGRLAEVTRPEDTEIDTIRARVEVSGEGVAPDRALVNLENDAFIYLDLGKNIYPLGKEPKVDCIFYLACDDLLRTPDAEIALDVTPADPAVVRPANPSEDLALSWEYFDGRKWRQLGRSGPNGVRPGGAEEAAFHDTTGAFTRPGTVTFRRPKDMEAVDVAGETARWIRVRLEQGDFGTAGTYTLDNDKWVFRDDRPLRPPALRSISLRAREDYRDVRHALAFNDFTYTDVTEVARTEYTIFQPFSPEADESPALYLGFSGRLPNEAHGIYFQMAEDLGPASLPSEGSEVATPELSRYHAARLAAWEGEQRVVWEYSTPSRWEPLAVSDATQSFTTSGFVDFVAPDDWGQARRFTEERFWLRARLEMGGYAKPPRILRVLTNVIDAYHHVTVQGEILGSSDATPLQTYSLLQGPLLEGEIIAVKERQVPPPEELAELTDQPHYPNTSAGSFSTALPAHRRSPSANPDVGERAIEPLAETGDGAGECWVVWTRVDSFFESGPRSRHYTMDYQSGKVTFGDGRRGLIPSEGLNNIVARQYRVGGGAAGNVNPHTPDLAVARPGLHRRGRQPHRGGRRRRPRDRGRGQEPRALHHQEPRSRGHRRGLRDAGAQGVDLAGPRQVRARPRPARRRHGGGGAQGRDRGRRPVAPAGAVQRDPALRQALPRRAPPGRHAPQRGPADLRRAVAQGHPAPAHHRHHRPAPPRHRRGSQALPAPLGGRPRRQGLDLRPRGAQDRADPPGRGGPRGRGGRLGRHARRGQGGRTSNRSGSMPTSCPTSSMSTSSRRCATRSCDVPAS